MRLKSFFASVFGSWCVCSVSISVVGEPAKGYEHFTGVYAYEATPYWPEFEIVKNDSELILQKPDSDWKMTLTASQGTLTAKEDKGEEFKLSFDPSGNHYTLTMDVPMATQTGTKKVMEQSVLVKLKPNPNAPLEKEYGVKAADLVNRIRESEDWIHQVKSFQLKAKDKWTKTPEGFEHRRKELQAQFPEAKPVDPVFAQLKPSSEGQLQIAFDGTRFRTYNFTKDDSMSLHIWDGKEFIAHENYFAYKQEHYAFRKELRRTNDILLYLMWPRSKYHSFWWQKFQMEDWEDIYGHAEKFVLVGKQDYRGTPCYVVECYPKKFHRVRRLFIGVKDNLRYGDQVYEQGQLAWEHWNCDYKEVRPGWWFPMKQGHHTFDRDENGKSFITATRDITVEDIRLDKALPDEMFTIDFKDGVEVNDDRFGGFVVYKYKKGRTEQEWEEIRQKAQQRTQEDDTEKKALDERIGQTPPEFPKECKWINTEPLTMEKLRGKPIVLQFWGIWCGPCHNYMQMLGKKTSDPNVIVIGIHTPEDDLSKIKTDMDKYKADGPVCVDVGSGWGSINEWYRVRRRPYWIAINSEGKMVGHTDNPQQAFELARLKQ